MVDKIIGNDCYGCGACTSACKAHAISMKLNNEGFYYPVVNQAMCTKCGSCLSVCPVLNTVFKEKRPLAGYAFIGNGTIRKNSSSGGAFGAIALQILDEGGYICGAAFAEDYKSVSHIIIHQKDTLQKLQKSKYLQSKTGNIYQKIRDLLDDQNKVFFCGTPCQVAGLKRFLGDDEGNLLTADLVCHAANSELAWDRFLESKGNIVEADFRDKSRFYPFGMKLMLMMMIR